MKACKGEVLKRYLRQTRPTMACTDKVRARRSLSNTVPPSAISSDWCKSLSFRDELMGGFIIAHRLTRL